jgi:hypothetical protein
MSGIEQRLSLPPFCCGLFQREKKNANVVVQQLDGVAGTLPEVLSADSRFSIPRAGLWLSFMDGLRDQLNSLVHLVLSHGDNSCRRPEGLPMPALASDAGEQKACSNEGSEGRCKKDRCTLK